MAVISVRAMTAAEFRSWREASVREYAAVQVAAGNWSPDEAEALAREANTAMLPDGLATPEMLLLRGVFDDGTPVGTLWIGLAHPRGAPDCAFLYDIEVVPAFRGAGHGRALLAAAEEIVRSHGIGRLELNVYGANGRAVRLYQAAGYEVVTQQMRKSLCPDG